MSVPNPQSGRDARREDETKREEIQQQSSEHGSQHSSGTSSLTAPIDDVEGSLVDPIQSMCIGGAVDHTRQSYAPPGKLFVGGVSGKTTTLSFTEYFGRVSLHQIFRAIAQPERPLPPRFFFRALAEPPLPLRTSLSTSLPPNCRRHH